MRKFFNGKAKVLSIFLDASDETLLERLLNCGETEEQTKIHISCGAMELQNLADYDLVIENYDMDKTIKTVSDFILKNFTINTLSVLFF